MAASDKELELRLMEAGNRLIEPPSSVDELIPLLDQVEGCLSRVEQSPSEAMQNSLSPSLKALVADQLLRHPDNDVKVAVAACLSEITRITAPDAPYDDDQMREVFQLIVSSFENLSDQSSCSFIKRTSILETVAKVRSCVVMLDLECDALIIEMFQHFLKSIRDQHPEAIFTSMATIMSLVLEESEEISVELLSPILASVKRDNEEVIPVARRLAEKVLENCSLKLKPYLTQAVESLGVSFDEFSSVVASICQAAPNAVDQKDTVAEKLGNDEVQSPLDKTTQEDKEILEAAVSTEQVGLANERSPKSVVSNGTVQTAEDKLLTDSNSIKKQEVDHRSDKSNNDNTSTVAGHDILVAENLVNSDSRSEESTLEIEKTSDSKLAEPDCVHFNEKDAEMPLDPKKNSKTDACSLRGDFSVEGAVSSENEQERVAQPFSPKPTEDSTDVASPTPSGVITDVSHSEKAAKPMTIPDDSHSEKAAQPMTIPDDCHSEKDEQPMTRPDESHSEKAAQPMTIPDESHFEKAAQPERKEGLSEETTPSVQDVPKKVIEGMSDSEVKTNKQSGKKVATVVSDKVNDVDETKKESGSARGSEAKSRTEPLKKVDSISNNLDGPSSRQLEDKKKRGRGKVIPEKDGTKTSTINDDEEVVASPKSVKPNIHDFHMEENPKTSSKRKHTPSKEKASNSMEYGENLVGLKVKVWWPKDRAFYEGFIHSFDAVKKKHKVHYDDGDMEILNLKREKWKIIEEKSEPDEEEAANNLSPDRSCETPQKKKAKTVDQRSKKTKMDASPKRGGGTSAGKSRSAVTKSGRKTKEDGKVDSKTKDVPKGVGKSDNDNVTKSKDHTSKSGSKSVDAASKVGNKSKNEDSGDTPKSTKSKQDGRVTPKASTKSKLDTSKASKSKISSNSKGKPLKSSGKSNTNGNSKSKSGPSKVDESESMKENSTDSAKVVESVKRKSPSWNKAHASDAVSGKKQRQ